MKHFTLKELTATDTELTNIPNKKQEQALIFLVDNVLDHVREVYGLPIEVNSGFRSPEVNKEIGGSSTSQHLLGEAADITGGSKIENKKIFTILKIIGKYDQLINENDYEWIHISYKNGKNRKQILNIKK